MCCSLNPSPAASPPAPAPCSWKGQGDALCCGWVTPGRSQLLGSLLLWEGPCIGSTPVRCCCEGNTLTCLSFVNQTLDASKSIPTKGCSPQTRTFGRKREPFMCITASRPAALCLPEVIFGSHQPHTSGFCTVKPIRTHTSGQKCSSRSMHSPQTQFPALWGITAPSSVLLELPGCCKEP